jgi:hypothetical protein
MAYVVAVTVVAVVRIQMTISGRNIFWRYKPFLELTIILGASYAFSWGNVRVGNSKLPTFHGSIPAGNSSTVAVTVLTENVTSTTERSGAGKSPNSLLNSSNASSIALTNGRGTFEFDLVDVPSAYFVPVGLYTLVWSYLLLRIGIQRPILG